MEKLKTIWTNFWGWLQPAIMKLFSDVAAKLLEIAKEEVRKLMDDLSSQTSEKRAMAFTAIRNRLNAIGLSSVISDSQINLAIEQAVSLFKGK